MKRVDLDERLAYWLEPHPAWKPNPEWPEDVLCVLVRGADTTVLVDPLVRDDLDPAAWAWLHEAIEEAQRPVAILVTCPWHERSARAASERYGAPVWAPDRTLARLGDVPRLTALPAGIQVFEPRGVDEGQVAFFVVPERTLVVAELFLGVGAGRLQLSPSPATEDLDAFLESMTELEQLGVERVLPGHGPPVVEDGAQAIALALAPFER